MCNFYNFLSASINNHILKEYHHPSFPHAGISSLLPESPQNYHQDHNWCAKSRHSTDVLSNTEGLTNRSTKSLDKSMHIHAYKHRQPQIRPNTFWNRCSRLFDNDSHKTCSISQNQWRKYRYIKNKIISKFQHRLLTRYLFSQTFYIPPAPKTSTKTFTTQCFTKEIW